MRVLLNGRLKYVGNRIYYHFSDQYGAYNRISLKIKVDKPEKNNKGEWIFPAEAYIIGRKIDSEVRERKWKIQKPAIKRTILQVMEEYFLLDGNQTTEGTRNSYKNTVSKFVNLYGNIHIDSISPSMMVEFRNRMLKHKNNDFTIAKDFRQLSALFSFGVRNSYIAINPISRYNRPHPKKKMPEIYSDAELTKLFNYLRTSDPGVMNQLFFLLLTGFRVDESCNIQWDQIDWNNKCILHHNQKGKRDELYPMSDILHKFIEGLPRTYRPYIFANRSRTNLHKHISKARQFCGITKKKAIHLFKKNYSTGLANVGTPSYILPDLAHHTSINTTKDAYIYTEMEEKRRWLNESHKRLAEKLQKKDLTTIDEKPADAKPLKIMNL